MMQVWYRIQNEIQRNPQKTLECANLCAKAYAEATGGEWKEITDLTSKEYKQNMVGLQAAISSIPLLAMWSGEFHPYQDEVIEKMLRLLISLDEDVKEHGDILLEHLKYAIPAVMANALWNLTKVYADRQSDRCNNFPILMDVEFVQRIPRAQGVTWLDLLPVVTAARWLARQIEEW